MRTVGVEPTSLATIGFKPTAFTVSPRPQIPGLGFEPRFPDPKSGVLPLDHPGMNIIPTKADNCPARYLQGKAHRNAPQQQQ